MAAGPSVATEVLYWTLVSGSFHFGRSLMICSTVQYRMVLDDYDWCHLIKLKLFFLFRWRLSKEELWLVLSDCLFELHSSVEVKENWTSPSIETEVPVLNWTLVSGLFYFWTQLMTCGSVWDRMVLSLSCVVHVLIFIEARCLLVLVM